MERGNPALRFFDQYLGPVLLLILKPFFGLKRKRPRQIQRIGILKSAAIGDTLLLSAILQDLKKWNPNLHITLFVGGSNESFAKLLSGVDEVQRLPLTKPWKAVSLIRHKKLDVMIDFDSWPRISALFTALSGAQYRMGFQTPGQYRHFLYDQVVPHLNTIHELENYRSLLRALNIPVGSAPQSLNHSWQKERTGNHIVFHLWPGGTKSHLKEWAFQNWQMLAEKILSQEKCQILLTGGPGDSSRNEEFLQSLPTSLRSSFKNVSGTTFAQTLLTLQSSRLVISVNTGIMHVAAALGTPTVGLHGPTNPIRWGPVGVRTRAVLSQQAGAGSLNLGFEYPDDINRMNGLSVEEVFQASQELLKETGHDQLRDDHL